MPATNDDSVSWVPKPETGHAVEFSLYFVSEGTAVKWNPTQRILGARSLSSRGEVVVLAEAREAPAEYLNWIETVLSDNPFSIDDSTATGGFLWLTQSPDAYAIPIINDLPPPFTSVTMADIVRAPLR